MKVREVVAALLKLDQEAECLARNVDNMENKVTQVVKYDDGAVLINASEGSEYLGGGFFEEDEEYLERGLPIPPKQE